MQIKVEVNIIGNQYIIERIHKAKSGKKFPENKEQREHGSMLNALVY